jgi:hypothetical protein
MRDGEVYHTVSKPGQACLIFLLILCAALTPYGYWEVSQIGQAGTRCGLDRPCIVGKEKVVRDHLAAPAARPPVPPHLMALTLEFMGQVIPLNFQRFERLLMPALLRCSSVAMDEHAILLSDLSRTSMRARNQSVRKVYPSCLTRLPLRGQFYPQEASAKIRTPLMIKYLGESHMRLIVIKRVHDIFNLYHNGRQATPLIR